MLIKMLFVGLAVLFLLDESKRCKVAGCFILIMLGAALYLGV